MISGAVVLAIYVAGVVWGLLVTDARGFERLAIALLWPIGPLAFVVTVAMLLVALPVAFPKVGIPFWVLVGALAWIGLIR